MTASTAAAPHTGAAAPGPSCRTCRDTGVYLAEPALDCPACPGPRYPEGDDE